mmetsp:Transcript_6131/g.9388  ORF Transcript_6131/g.9388 Transcript_6131/m.9388 type:complete len:169 (+) Transcript_6131:82-588(+)
MMASATANNNPLDYPLRLCESVAFILHGILGLCEPFTGCLRSTFQDNGAMPTWFWPLAGSFLICVAIINFRGNDVAVLMNQAYIAEFHMGGVLYHNSLGHHPASGVGPGMFVFLAFAVACMRAPIWMAFGGLMICYVFAVGLTKVLVKPKAASDAGQSDESARLLRVD